MKARTERIANEVAIFIPLKLAEEAELSGGESVEVSREGDHLIVHTAANRMLLEELIAGITPENRHPETDWGPRVGREEW